MIAAMSEQPPQQFVPYPSGNNYGTREKLQALADGYFGLNNVFMVNLIMCVPLNLYMRTLTDPGQALVTFGVAAVVLFVTILLLSLPQNKKIGFGLNWSPVSPAIASILMGLNSALCCGIFGYIIMQMLAANEMKKYGVQTGFFGMKKKAVQEVIDRMPSTVQMP